MAEHPYTVIDSAYSDAVSAAIDAHAKAVAGLNAKLEKDLAAAADAERATVLLAFEQEIAPIRAVFDAAVEAAALALQSAKKSAQADVDAFESAEQTAKEAEIAANESLRAKLAAGTATVKETQAVIADLIVSSGALEEASPNVV